MESQKKDIELSPIRAVQAPPEVVEEDVIIGRFRKISSAKSMANANGASPFSDPPPRSDNDDVESGLQFKSKEYMDGGKEDEQEALMEKTTQPTAVGARGKITKSSFRDIEKPSRFKDQPSATRFQMNEEAKSDGEMEEATEESAGDDSDDPLTVTDTKYGRSFRHFTREALPRLDNYRNVLSLHAAPRPTLDELHNASLSRKPGQTLEKDRGLSADMSAGTVKFGWIKGVLMRCLLNIWGVMLFLRLSWVVGQAGVAQSFLLILTTTLVTTITALSMSAISTNGVIKGGGTYYMISRSLGPEFGGSIGLIFSMANAIACAMYVVGFCESLMTLIPETGYMVNAAWDQAIYGCITIVILTAIVVVGMEWEAKAQIGLLVILLAAIVDFIIGTIVGPKSDLEIAKGFVGYDMALLKKNMVPDYRFHEGVHHDFFSVFAIFFPAATGILAGANISGDLKDPQKSIPKGTLLAIFLTTLSYLLIALLAGWTVLRDASGDVADVAAMTMSSCAPNCTYGLQHNFQVIELVSGFGPLIYAGCFAATLSSALASLVSAPKVFQALCKDKLYPGMEMFARGYGKNAEPVRGYILTFVIATAFILIGNLNQIAPLISNFFLAAYTLINFSTFHASLAKPVGWRPTFKFYNMWLSLVGSVVCVAVMFLISWITALLTFAVVLALYLIVSYRKPDVNWGSTTQAQTYKNALSGVHHLNLVTDHVKNFRPQILVLTGFPGERPALTDFTYLLTKGLSLMVCGHVVANQVSNKTRNALANRAYAWFTKRKVKAFYALVDDAPYQAGASALIQATGLGKLKPNILLMGFKNDWNYCPRGELTDYFEIMHKALDVHMALAILKVDGGLNCGQALDPGLQACLDELASKESSNLSRSGGGTYKESSESLALNGATPASQGNSNSACGMVKGSSMSDLSMGSPTMSRSKSTTVSGDPGAKLDPETKPREKDGCRSNDNIIVYMQHTKPESKECSRSEAVKSSMAAAMGKVVGRVAHAVGHSAARRVSSVSGANLTHFTKKQSGNLDVWWLYDDGGLTLLLPYIMSTRRNWASCRLRVFTLANKQTELEFEERNMASLLSKFRIDYSALKMIPDITRKPRDSTLAYFDRLISKFRQQDNPDDPDSAQITEADLLAARDRTHRHLRLRELIREHSSSSRLVCVTLPMPRRRSVAPPQLYYSWLEAIAGGGDPAEPPMPPVLFVRGNQTSVLTFYS